MVKDKFTERIYKWCQKNPGEDLTYYLKCIKEAEAQKKEISRKWKQIAEELLQRETKND